MVERIVIDSIEDPGDAHPFDAEALALALASVPSISPTCATWTDGQLSLIWGAPAPPFLLGPVSSAAWAYIDGTVTVRDLADDLAYAGGVDPDVARRHLAHLVVRLAAWGLVRGVRGRPARASDEVAIHRAGFRREQVGDQIVEITEVDVPLADVERVARGLASLGDLAPPTSCAGRRLYLDHDADTVHLAIGDRRLGIRTADPGLADWLRSLPSAVSGPGPTEIFVAGGDPALPEHPHRRLYDPVGRLLATTADEASLRRAVAGAVVGRNEVPGSGSSLTARLLERDGRGALASASFADVNHGLVRHLRSRGIEVVPSTTVRLHDEEPWGTVVDPDRALIAIRSGPLFEDDARCWRRVEVAGLIGRAPINDLVPAEWIQLLVRDTDTDPGDAATRARTMERAAELVASLPSVVVSNGQRDLGAIVDGVESVLGGAPG